MNFYKTVKKSNAWLAEILIYFGLKDSYITYNP